LTARAGIKIAGLVLMGVLASCLPRPGTARADAVTVTTGDGYAPFVDQALPEGGWHRAVIARVFQHLNTTLTVEILPWKRALDKARSGEALGSFTYVPTPERERDFLFSRPLSEVTRRVFVAASAKWQFTGPDSLKGRRACMELGSANPPVVEEMIAAGTIMLDQPKDLATCARMVALGRSDFFILNDYSGLAAIRAARLLPGSVVAAAKPYATTTQHFLISRTYPEAEARMRAFNEALEAVQAMPDYATLRARYLGAETH
jgi:polar amino acid transport system substrate-binding protein